MLKTQISCEVDDLIKEVQVKSGKTYDVVEKAFFKFHIYPTSCEKMYLTSKSGNIIEDDYNHDYNWLEEALKSIFNELKINRISVV